MLVVKNNQLKVFEDDSLKIFEDDMASHIKEFFPNHFIAIGEKDIRNTIQYGYSKAIKYGFTTKRNVCLYINNMLVLGSNFDYDPMYSWAQEILRDKSLADPILRIDNLCDKTIEIY